MEDQFMKKFTLCSVITIFFLMLVGCKKEEIVISTDSVQTATILINDDGTVQAATVEEFDKEYYNLSELQTFITEQINDYNQTQEGEGILLESLELVDGKAVMILNYTTMEDYSLFNQVEAYYSTIEGLSTSGIILPDAFISASDGAFASQELATKNSKYQVVAIDEDIDLMVDGTIKYYSNGILADDSKLQTGSDGKAYVIFKP